jgi:hypothetical protein
VAKFYADENFPHPVVEELRALGHDVLTIQETGRAGQGASDEDVLDSAAVGQRAVLTLNRKHFMKLHRKRQDHAGIVACTVDLNFIALAHRINAAVTSQADLTNKLIRFYRP